MTEAPQKQTPHQSVASGTTTTVTVGYQDLGAQITGPQADLNLGIQLYVDGTPESAVQLDTTKPGTHTIDYVVTDREGRTATSTRTVIVSAPQAANDNAPTVATSTPIAANDNQATTTVAAPTTATSTAQ